MMLKARPLFYVAAPILALALMGQGCGGSQPVAGPDGGIFRSKDKGVAWSQLKTLNVGAKQGSIANVGIATLAIDPQDVKAVYAGTEQNGVIYSLDGGESWEPAQGLSSGRVPAVAVDPKDKCTIYATRENQVFKTTNCSRDWSAVYYDPRSIKFTSLVVDWFNSNVLYAGTSDGDIVKSENAGATWRVANRVDGYKINQIAMDPRDSRIVYAATDRYGIMKTTDAGATWVQIRKELQEFDGANRANIVTPDPSVANRVYTVSKYGILQSNDGGATWTALKLPTPSGTVDMKAFAINPKDSRELVYATDKAVIWSGDGGQTWTPKKLPTSRGASIIIYDPSSTAAAATIYLGTLPPKS
jgi:photosystem II stability/assembly factor-like uncharacterized protein